MTKRTRARSLSGMTPPDSTFSARPGWTRRATLAALGVGFAAPLLPLSAEDAPEPPWWFIKVSEESVLVHDAADNQILRYWRRKPADSPVASPNAGYFHPFTTPAGVTLTDLAPDDHPHHRGIFCAWLEVRTAQEAGDFWGWGQPAPTEGRRIVSTSPPHHSEARGRAEFTTFNEWRAQDTVLLKERLIASLRATPAGRVLDLEYSFTAPEDTTLGQWAFSGFCVRLRKDGTLTLHDPEGPVDRPAPSHLDPKSDWPDRPWYAAQLILKSGQTVGTAVINHPNNPPTLWHNVAGISMLNPCIIAPGPVALKAEEPLRLRYRVVAFDGPVPVAALNELAENFKKTRQRRIIKARS